MLRSENEHTPDAIYKDRSDGSEGKAEHAMCSTGCSKAQLIQAHRSMAAEQGVTNLVCIIVHSDSASHAHGKVDMRHCTIRHIILLASTAT